MTFRIGTGLYYRMVTSVHTLCLSYADP